MDAPALGAASAKNTTPSSQSRVLYLSRTSQTILTIVPVIAI